MNDEDIKILEEMLKIRKEQKEIIECAGGYCRNCDEDIRALTNAIQVIKNSIPVEKIKEIVDECIPRGKNIITGKEEYQTNANANSYLAQEILRLLEGK